MGNVYFTEEQIAELKKNPNVKNVSEKAITHTEEFREYFVNEYKKGKAPSEILRKAGFRTEVLGKERVRNISKNFRKMAEREDGFADKRKGGSGRPRTRDLTPEEEIARFKHKVKYLEQENDF